jgi:NAD(P)-dependent dehydrogenase (short-subunit alcohol dehydrogenase family)
MNLRAASVAVTGGAHGIGRAIAERFAGAGARVAIGDVNADAARAVAAAIGGEAIGNHLDVADASSFSAFLDAAEEAHGPLGVVINNAGVDWMGPFHEEPIDVTRRELEINLLGTIIGSRLALQRMLLRGRGHIVNVASGVGRIPLPGSAVYAATKHGIVGLTESLRLEYRASGIGFTLVHPSQVKTGMLDGQPHPRLLPQVSADDVSRAVLDAVRDERFEIWIPSNQWLAVKLGNLLPRAAREAMLLAIGVGRIAGDADFEARRGYRERMFGRS